MKRFNNKGAALIGAIALAAILTITALGFLYIAQNEAINENQSFNNDKAFFAAESGLLLGATWISDPTNWSTFESMGEGAIQDNILPNLTVNNMNVEVDIVRTADGGRIQSTAQCQNLIGYNKMHTQDVETGESTFNTAAFDCAIFCDGVFDFGGCGNIAKQDGSAAAIHSNNELIIRGNAQGNMNVTSSVKITVPNSKTIEGSGTAPVFDLHHKAEFTNGTTVANVPEIPFPDIDLTPWYNVANANGKVFNGFSSISSYTPDGGILWVNGDVSLSGGPGTTFTGQLIATGNVSIDGQVDINAPDSGFAIASQSGDINITTSGTIKGLIYAKNGDYKQTANGTIEGQYIIKGDIEKEGNSGVVAYKKCVPKSPEGGGGDGAALVAGTWREINVSP